MIDSRSFADRFPSRFFAPDAARKRFGESALRYGDFLTVVDPPADAAIAALRECSAGQAAHWIDAGGTKGAAAIVDAPRALHDFFELNETLPVWVDDAALDRGGEVLFRTGPVGGLTLGLKSLVTGYASPGGNKPLVFSGRLREQAPHRLNETSRFVHATSAPGGLKRFADGYRITLKVRLMHARVREMILKSGRWNAKAWGAPINQSDMAATALLFSIFLLDGVRQLGLRFQPNEVDDFLHLWRYSAHLMGVTPELQVSSEPDAHRLGEIVLATQGPPDQDSRDLFAALMNAGIQASRNPRELELAKRRAHFAHAICRELIGKTLADDLGVEKNSWRLAMPAVKRIVRATERVRTSVPVVQSRAKSAGARYWKHVVMIGLEGATSEFVLPDKLAG
ncbi:MAG: oxygenase MpaB family protein [Polyangiaceae bacterium]